jgi:hypothetical protein
MTYAATTSVSLETSIADIIGMVKRAGATQVGQMEGVDSFLIAFRLGDRQMRFTVPLVTQYKGPIKGGNGRQINQRLHIDQANRQKGRALWLVIKAKLESVESGVETFEQAFLANIVMADGATVYERIAEHLALEYTSGVIQPAFGLLTGPSK